MLVLLGNT